MKFLVTASRFQLNNPPRNPFYTRIDGFGSGTVQRNTYDVDADSETHVRELWDKAQKDGFQQGFTIEKIEHA